MRHRLRLTAAVIIIAAIVGAAALTSPAGQAYTEGQFTLGAAANCATQAVPLTSQSALIDRIVIYNDGDVTCAVAVVAADIGVRTAVDAWALAANAGESRRPPGAAALSYAQSTVVTGDVPIVAFNTSTNYAPFPVRDLEIVAHKATNATDCVYYYRIFSHVP